ncbi:MAG: AAA family ATPase [Caldisericia bacterium]|nr:AAA family ATPase [Caldisericia bacterium]MDD4615000.1 AAA family ATPase [Caldisericia bacterium]
MHKVIAITGLCGAGKTTAALHMKEKGYQYLRFGQIVIDVLKEQNQPVTPENEKRIRNALRQTHGMEAFALANAPKISIWHQKGNIVIDGLYSFAEYKVLKEQFADTFITLAIYAPPELRYKRLSQRHASPDDDKILFRPLTPKEAMNRDYDEIENADKGGPIAMADWTIVNTKTRVDLENEIKEFLWQI